MSVINKIKIAIQSPKEIIIKTIRSKPVSLCLSDERALRILYRLRMGKKLKLNPPVTFNEKLQWLKLYDRNPLYTKLCDKFEVRKYISETIGDNYLIPLLGAWDNFDEINFETLPNQFVLKCTHDSGGIVICEDKRKLDYKKAKNKLNKSLKRNYYYFGREWPYKNIKPRIICEKYMVDQSGIELKDYKFMCFNGEPKIIQVISERKNGQYYINHFDLEWNRVEIRRINHKENKTLFSKKPNELEKMITISKELCKSMLFARIDLYTTEKECILERLLFSRLVDIWVLKMREQIIYLEAG